MDNERPKENHSHVESEKERKTHVMKTAAYQTPSVWMAGNEQFSQLYSTLWWICVSLIVASQCPP